MEKKPIIIIGAGLGGLSTGCYAQMNGFDSQIFEQHDQPGGLAATWERNDYIIDGGIHFLSGHKPGIAFYDILKEVGVEKHNFIDMTVYGRLIDGKTGTSIDITNDLQKFQNDLLALFPEDKDLIDELIAGTLELGKKDLSIFGFEKPIELMGMKDKIRDFWTVRGLWKFFTGKYNLTVREIVKEVHNPLLGEILMNIFLPDVPYWFILMVLATVTTNQMCLLGDGSNEFARSIEKHYLNLGGKIRYSTPVKKIVVDKNQVIGVELESGQQISADYVISAADGYHTIYDLLGGHYTDQKIEERYKSMNVLPPYIVISYGVAREFNDEPWMILIRLEQPFKVGTKRIKDLAIRIFNYSSNFAPPGKTVVQVLFEAEWDYWKKLRENKQLYDSEKEKVANIALSKLEKYYPGISQKVEVTDIATPYTFWRYTRSHKGSIMGWLPTPDKMMEQLKKTLPGLQNFYMAGQWSMSVGGVPPSIISGRHVIQLICHSESKKFETIK